MIRPAYSRRAARPVASLLAWALVYPLAGHAKIFQNSYVSLELPDTWACTQEGVAWTCTPAGTLPSKEAVIVLAAKVAGPEDNMANFLNFLRQPKRIVTRVGTPMPSQVSYAQNRVLAGSTWVQAQHLGSEIQDYYTLYLATVKEQLAILISFSAEKNHYGVYNSVFDHAMKTLRIVASQELLFPKNKPNMKPLDPLGIQGQAGAPLGAEIIAPPSAHHRSGGLSMLPWLIGGMAVIVGGFAYALLQPKRRKKSKSKPPRPPQRNKVL